jgi:hypothetical protein
MENIDKTISLDKIEITAMLDIDKINDMSDEEYEIVLLKMLKKIQDNTVLITLS